ncbi:methyl-accepting chemotaxis protein [Spirochaetia bacterium]|nr:methyl-accepting chemotaxis protein [Spirochaetia bacterium]
MFVSLLIIVVSLGIGLVSLIVSTNIVKKDTVASLQDHTELASNLLNLTISGRNNILQELANRASTRTLDFEIQKETLYGDIALHNYLDLAIVDLSGVAHYIGENTTANLGDRAYIQKAVSGKQSMAVLVSKVINKTVVMYAVPITVGEKVVQVLLARTSAASFSETAVHISEMAEGHAYIIDGTGKFIGDENEKLVLEQFSPIEAAKNDPAFQGWADAIQNILAQKNGITTYKYNRTEKIVGFHSLPEHNMTVVVEVDKDFIMRNVDKMRNVIIAIIAASILAGLGGAWLLSHSIVKPINKTITILKDIAEGEGDLTKRIEINSNDEIGQLAHYFNESFEKIRALIVTIIDGTDSLSETGAELSSSMTQTAATINAIAGNIHGMKDQVDNQSESVTQSSDLILQVAGNIETLNTQVEKQNDCVSRSSAAIEEMFANIQSVTRTLMKNADNVKKLSAASEVGHEGLQAVSVDIQAIAQESEGLLEINGVMQNIASQTNLLSMNAAIEAAHAGEAGKGFAVVADEIRKLAENSSVQSKSISAVLKKIKDSIDKIIKSTDSVLLQFETIGEDVQTVSDEETNIRNAMEEQNEGSKNVLQAVSELRDLTNLVNDGVEGMLKHSNTALEEERNLSNATFAISNSIKEITTGADEINGTVARVNEIALANKEKIDVLITGVGKFKVDDGTKKTKKQKLELYVWDGSLIVGNDLIDTQHQELFERLNDLLRAMDTEPSDSAGLKKAIDFLGGYTNKHFFEEEQLQKKFKYPDYGNHHVYHESFKAAVRELSHDLILKGPSEELFKDVKLKIGGWLITHIKTQDTRIARCIREAQEQGKAITK